MTPAPIALFVYNRPWHTQQTVETLQKNELAEEIKLFIYFDGAKGEKLPKVLQKCVSIQTIKVVQSILLFLIKNI